MYPALILKPGKEHSLKRFHPWVFSGAVQKADPLTSDGDIVEVLSHKGEFLGLAHYHTGSIIAKVFSFSKVIPDKQFWLGKIKNAFILRQGLYLTDNRQTNCYRLVHGEGDGLPGLIIDWYNGTAVVQARSLGMHNIREIITGSLIEIYKGLLRSVYYKSSDLIGRNSGLNIEDGYLYGNKSENIITENDHQFFVDWETGQKTGFFIDQRENRKALSFYAKDKSILNTFCYSGGFSVYALQAGASSVVSIDSSAAAIALTEKNIRLNGFSGENHNAVITDVKDFLNKTGENFDIIVLDPPAYAKNISNRHHAVIGYKNLNLQAMKKIKKGGLLFTFSCSQAIDRQLFTSTVTAAAIETGRNITILQHLSQPADHPVSIYHPEGEYLKGLVLLID